MTNGEKLKEIFPNGLFQGNGRSCEGEQDVHGFCLEKH